MFYDKISNLKSMTRGGGGYPKKKFIFAPLNPCTKKKYVIPWENYRGRHILAEGEREYGIKKKKQKQKQNFFYS